MLSWDVHLCCCIYVFALLYVPAASILNISAKDDLPTGAQNREQMDGDSSFLQLRGSLPSYSQPFRPYTILTTAKNFPSIPKPRNYRPSRLLRILGPSFDPFWMSVDQPPEVSVVCTDKGNCDAVSRGDSLPVGINSRPSKENFNFSASAVLMEARENQRRELAREASGVKLSFLPPDVASSVRTWLVNSATCGLRSQWVDVGPAFWPRWLRQTDCDESGRVRSCSFPSGMACVRAQTTHIKILAWHCLKVRDDESKQIEGDMSGISMLVGISEEMRKCLWRPVPYPVVTACACKCK
ncbi:noggin-like [Corythoichthys intestinalis]|uniref:noggin-like n=1 Tax=Corythoichthys intestinalis TaxID=161448 RepID=UPI0025A59B45|nr:noggin-like [Corythoichthys intestinalis]